MSREPTYSPPIIEIGTVSEPTLGRMRAMSVSGSAPRRRGSLVEEIPPRELSIDLVADERFGRVTGRAGAS